MSSSKKGAKKRKKISSTNTPVGVIANPIEQAVYTCIPTDVLQYLENNEEALNVLREAMARQKEPLPSQRGAANVDDPASKVLRWLQKTKSNNRQPNSDDLIALHETLGCGVGAMPPSDQGT